MHIEATTRQNSFTAIGADGDSYSVTAQVPKNIKSIGGLVEHLYKNGHTNRANRISKALREMSDRTVLRNQAHAEAKHLPHKPQSQKPQTLPLHLSRKCQLLNLALPTISLMRWTHLMRATLLMPSVYKTE